jgi:hypothetical protein
LTMPQLEALEERRMIGVRYARFNAGLLATILYNARPGVDEPVEVWDFIPGFSRDSTEVEADKLRRSIKDAVGQAFIRMQNRTVEQVRQEAAAMIQRMTDAGTEDAESIVREVFEDIIKVPFNG